jgi:hypothetical protein
MNVVLRKSRKLIGTLTGPNSIDDGVPLPIALKTQAYRSGRGIVWEPDPPPNPKRPVEIPYLLDGILTANSKWSSTRCTRVCSGRILSSGRSRKQLGFI